MRMLLTGASGFLGKKVGQLLEECGVELFHLTRRPLGTVREILWNFFDPLPTLPSVDGLVHMAASVDYSDTVQDLVLCNTIPAVRLAEWAALNSIPVFHTSTASVHGKKLPWGVSSGLAPTGRYEKSKLLSEEAFRIICPNYCIFRLHGIYGHTGPSHLGLNIAIREAFLHGKNPILRGNGLALRNYICVDDAAAWIVAETCAPHENRRTVYVAGSEIMPIQQWLQTIVDTLLPGGKIEKFSGEGGEDIIVESSPPPIQLQSFREYLQRLKGCYRSP